MLITKSLFVDYNTFPKLARWKVNNKATYNKIRKTETDEEQQHIIQIGQAVENAVLEYLQGIYGPILSLFDDEVYEELKIQQENDGEDDTMDDIYYQVQDLPNAQDILQTNHQKTIEAIKRVDAVLFQPGFVWNNCYVRGDFMVRNDDGTYTLIEVKAKSNIRKEISHDGNKEAIGEVDDKFRDDISFQRMVINKVMEEAGLPSLNGYYFYYLNKDYVYDGVNLDLQQLIIRDRYGMPDTKVISGEKKGDRSVERINGFLTEDTVTLIVDKMRNELSLSEDAFNKLHRFPGNKYLEYFGKDKLDKDDSQFGTVLAIPKLHFSKAPYVADLYYQNRVDILELGDDELDPFSSGQTGEFIEKYKHSTKTGEPIVIAPEIKNILDTFQYPICFYDYETVSVPVPFLGKTYPYQQVVVQYSLHEVFEDGSMRHFGGLLGGLENQKRVEMFEITENPNAVGSESEKVVYGQYKDLLEEMLIDIGEHIHDSTFIVWYSPFENTGGGTRTHTSVRTPDFESSMSTSSITQAKYNSEKLKV